MYLTLFILGIVALAWLLRQQYTHWARRGLPHEPPHIPFGSLNALRHKQRSFGLIMYDIYMRRQEKLVGVYLFFRPAILIRDADLVRQILTVDFASFHDRGVKLNENADLFSMCGQEWKTLRHKLTPSFSTGKLKGMFGAVNDVGDKLVAHLNTVLKSKESELIEMKEVFTTYAVDIIGSVIFGLDIDSYSNPENEFRKVSSKLFQTHGILQTLHGIAAFICPSIADLLTRLGYQDPIFKALLDIVRRTVAHREQHHIVRRDMLQLLIQLRNTGKISEDDKNWDIETAAENLKAISIEMIASQAFLFYIAGSETTSATAAFTIYELAMYPETLQRAQQEVVQVLEKHALKPTEPLTYEAVHDMKYLDLCIMETLRKYPGLPFLNRLCTVDYAVPGTNFTITKGTPIVISLFGLHRDPEHFPEPERYNPERFSEEQHNYNATAYMPFGEGPRHCIAQRMGVINAKVAVIKLLANFNVHNMERKELEFIFDPAPVLLPKDGLKVRLSRKQ